MMKYKYIFAWVLAGLLLALNTSCKKNVKPAKNLTSFEVSMSNKDSAEVAALVGNFFDNVKSNQIDRALSMLYQTPLDNVEGQPKPVDGEEKAKVRTLFTSLPILQYQIDYIKFNQAYSNEVKCTLTVGTAGNDHQDLSTRFYFKPVKYNEQWYLCLLNSEHGDMGIVPGKSKDSLEKDYSVKQQLKSE